MSVEIEPITEIIGAYVHVDADNVTAGDAPARILDALERHNVLVFPQVSMTDETFLELTEALGEKHDIWKGNSSRQTIPAMSAGRFSTIPT